ncbi:uncharacterized protein LOC113297373 isoform X2 [Papaver somniferum]|uniref:uncharacterized protein LOC113297373 isoform X2 n=1 Tax=Papaver somniferum TaxID=3469 RepID=UPI000E705BE1|nr:uncharacterized protein LOC113297373 isoform X2 [Papaver somniferum]
MADSLTITGGSHFKLGEPMTTKNKSLGHSSRLRFQRKSTHLGISRNLSVRAEYDDGSRGGGSGDFVAGFVLGGAVFGTLAYLFAPQIRRSLLNEDEYGFRRAKRPIYYDDGLETRETLNAKISQLNSAIDNVSSRLRGGKNKEVTEPIETDSEIEATI